MNNEEFERVVDDQIRQCKNTLANKATIYAADDPDRLCQFKKIATLSGCTQLEAVRGCMAKHTTLLYDLIQLTESLSPPSIKQWEETLKDQINYIYLLRAVLTEEKVL